LDATKVQTLRHGIWRSLLPQLPMGLMSYT
jgi:hypothetical protein